MSRDLAAVARLFNESSSSSLATSREESGDENTTPRALRMTPSFLNNTYLEPVGLKSTEALTEISFNRPTSSSSIISDVEVKSSEARTSQDSRKPSLTERIAHKFKKSIPDARTRFDIDTSISVSLYFV